MTTAARIPPPPTKPDAGAMDASVPPGVRYAAYMPVFTDRITAFNEASKESYGLPPLVLEVARRTCAAYHHCRL